MSTLAKHKTRKTALDPTAEMPPPPARRFPVALTTTAVVPWVLLAGLYTSGHIDLDADEPRPTAARTAGAEFGAPGEWGQIDTLPIDISPPLEYIPDDDEPVPSTIDWWFAGTSTVELGRWLEGAGLPKASIEPILAGSRPDPRIAGVQVRVGPDLVRSFPPETRARIYLRLAETELNNRQVNAFRFFGSADDWFRNVAVSPRTLELVRPLLYPHEGFQLFADIDLVRGQIADRDERRRLLKRLFREKTLLMNVHIPNGISLDGVVEYWGRGGRMTDIRPLLESVAARGPDASIDVVHLLPAFARRHLYRYPQVSLADLEKGALANCFWTAMNFFNRRPFDDRFLDLRFTVETLKRDYYLVHDEFRLGDVAVFYDGQGNPYHAAVYVAGGILFGKNGNSSLAPWTLLPAERLRGYYPQHAGGQVSYFRKRDL